METEKTPRSSARSRCRIIHPTLFPRVLTERAPLHQHGSDTQHTRQIPGDYTPAFSAISRSENVAARSPEVHPARIECIRSHALPKDRLVHILLRQTLGA